MFLPPPGRYSISDTPDDIFEVIYEDAFNYSYGISEEIVSIDPDGGIYTFCFNRYTPQNGPAIYIYGDEDIEFLHDAFSVFNSGKSTYWNPHMTLFCGYDYELESAYIQVVCPPNITGEYIRNRTCLLVGDGIRLEIHQDKGGGYRYRNVTYTADKGTSEIRAEVDRAQVGVEYTLYRNNKKLETKSGRGENLTLVSDMIPGYYKVVASYGGQTMSLASKQFFTGMSEMSGNRNWICVQTYNDMDALCDLTYYDGLGYPSQTLQVAASGSGCNDIVQPIVYDALSREARKYLSYSQPDNAAQYVNDVLEKQNDYYLDKYDVTDRESAYAYTQDTYDSSPLNRISRSRNAGVEFQSEGRTVDNGYMGNGSMTILRLDAARAADELVVNGYYDANALSGIRTEDEDGAVTVVFYDEQDRVIYEDRQLRNGTDEEHLITRYVYDDCGRLAWVVTPKGTAQLSDSQRYGLSDDFTKQNCYVYVYDGFGRTVEKHMPGREPEYMVYDLGDRLVMSQDGNLRDGVFSDQKPQWIIYRYDIFGRQTEQAVVTDTSLQANSRETLQEQFDAGQAPALYDSPTSQTLQQQVYDSYGNLPSKVRFLPADGMTTQIVDGQKQSLLDNRVTGLLTYERLSEIEHGAYAESYYHRAYYYDYKGRIIQTVVSDPDNNIHRTTNKYDFAGNVIAQRESYTYGNKTDSLDRTFEYDSRNRLLKETAQFNGGEQAVVAYTYDDLGQLTGKTYGTGTYAIHETMDYNLQGWLTEKSSELFDMTLGFYDTEKPSYTGNITSWQWQHKGDTAGNGPQNRYVFTYDDLSRLTNTDQYVNNEETRQNVERCLSYDHNGNLHAFIRYENGELTSNSTYQYDGNLLVSYRPHSVFEASDASSGGVIVTMSGIDLPRPGSRLYEYDANGNATRDYERELDMTYNSLNLLEKVVRNDTIVANYSYLADGMKLSVTDTEENGLYYLGSLVYEKHANTIGLESVPFSSGRIVATSGNDTEVRYFLTDHLGSVRVVATDKDNVLERNDYQPFGKRWNTASMPVANNRYRFSGKEDQAFVGLPFSDYGTRMYDSERMRWLTQDPLMEKYYSIGQYNYCAGNPVKYIDPNGKWIESAWDFASLLLGFDSLTDNIKSGNVGGIVVDSFGIVLDGAALLLPIPGGVSAGIKAARTTDKAVDAAKASKAVEKASDATKALDSTGDAQKLIGPAGDPGGTVTRQIPDGWTMEPSKKGMGTKFKDPANPTGNNVRVQEGNPNSPNPAQRTPYVKETRNGVPIDKNGNPVSAKDPNAHIPRDEYKYNR